MNQKKSNTTDLNRDQIDSAFQSLKAEAQSLFQVLDYASEKIRDLEHNLSELKAHFPFRSLLLKGKPSMTFSLRDNQLSNVVLPTHRSNIGYCTRECWYLAWEPDETTKKFRLFLISAEQEVPVLLGREDLLEDLMETEIPKSKKPLIETDLPTRLRFSEYLIRFISDFKGHLRRYRALIEGQSLAAFPNDEVPF
jgi:hypothetical protein